MRAVVSAVAVEQQHPIRTPSRADPVRDEDERAGAGPEGGLRAAFGGMVEVAGGLVEHQDRRGGQVRAHERQQLPSRSREVRRG